MLPRSLFVALGLSSALALALPTDAAAKKTGNAAQRSGAMARAQRAAKARTGVGHGRPVGIRTFEAPDAPFEPARLPTRLASALVASEALVEELAAGPRDHADLARRVETVGELLRGASGQAAELSDDSRAMMVGASARLVDALKVLDGTSGKKKGRMTRYKRGLAGVNHFLTATRQAPMLGELRHDGGRFLLAAGELYDADPKAYQSQMPEGSHPVPGAARVRFSDGSTDAPDHRRVSRWTPKALRTLVDRLAYKPAFPIFVDSEKGRPYIQIGAIGPDNYPADTRGKPDIIVYGRKWFIPSYIPTSEVVQTVLIGLKSAEEHEVREKLTWANPARDGKHTTQGNTHVDGALYAKWKRIEQREVANPAITTRADVTRVLGQLRLANRKIRLRSMKKLPNGRLLLRVAFDPPPPGTRGELVDGEDLTFLTEAATASDVAFGLLDEIVRQTHRHVEDNFRIDGETRFNRTNDTWQALGDFVGFAWGDEAKLPAHPDNARVDEALYKARYDWMGPKTGPAPGTIMRPGQPTR